MPYLHFIQTKLDSKSGQIEGLDVTFQMHSMVKIFDIIKYLINEKNQKLKKKKNQKNRKKLKNAISSLHINEIKFKRW